MNPSEKEDLSPLVRLKEKWCTLEKHEQDYWRKQFASRRSSLSLRREIGFKLGVVLFFPIELTQFRRWLTDQDRLIASTQKFELEAAALLLDFKKAASDPSCDEVHWLYCFCLKDLRRRAKDSLISGRPWTAVEIDKFYDDALFVCYLGWLSATTPRNHLN
jgi:hypothetical protein